MLWRDTLGEIIAEYGITQTQYAILASLRWFEDKKTPATQTHLARQARNDKMTLSKALRRLEKNGLVTGLNSVTDNRATNVAFTERGHELINKAVISIESAGEAFLMLVGRTEESLPGDHRATDSWQ
ncbi:MarR family winged helix-turn-helix transcriptional regulator [Maridesulfovibrio sp. FT414]|uniref:MarR family winged helix-turn-helix transcriptional regulator n=1 Tax=Maridesulfovibrio sp. FT414 TaxID=2979469 RepID=UPI003D80A3AF